VITDLDVTWIQTCGDHAGLDFCPGSFFFLSCDGGLSFGFDSSFAFFLSIGLETATFVC
jgi:hypothetical protein